MDLVQLTGQERVDLADLSYGLAQVPTGVVNELFPGFLAKAGDTCIIQGFVPGTQTANGPVTVGIDGSLNTAWLAMADGSTVTYGVFCAGGTAAQAVDISTFAAGTYNIYVRFNRTPGEAQNRAFWSSVDGAEYAKLTNTRLVGAWEVRIETAQPSPEWLLIGSAAITAGGSGQGNLVTVTDKRPLYFEGSYASQYKPTWGGGSDRGARQANGLSSLRQTIDALKQCLVDIKGRGLANWYDAAVSGLNVGTAWTTSDAARANAVQVGDASFYLYNTLVGTPGVNFDSGTKLEYSRNNLVLSFKQGNVDQFNVGPYGSLTIGGTAQGFPLAVNGTASVGQEYLALFQQRAANTAAKASLLVSGTSGIAQYEFGFTSAYASPLFTLKAIMSNAGGLNQLSTNSVCGVAYQLTLNSTVSGDQTHNLYGKDVNLYNGGQFQVLPNAIFNNNLSAQSNLYLRGRTIAYQNLIWVSGHIYMVLNGDGSTSTSSTLNGQPNIGVTTQASYNDIAFGATSGSNGKVKVVKARFNQNIPSGAVVLCSTDNGNTCGYAISPAYFNGDLTFCISPAGGNTDGSSNEWRHVNFAILYNG